MGCFVSHQGISLSRFRKVKLGVVLPEELEGAGGRNCRGSLGVARRNQLQSGKMLLFFFRQMRILRYFTSGRLWGVKAAGVMDPSVSKSS